MKRLVTYSVIFAMVTFFIAGGGLAAEAGKTIRIGLDVDAGTMDPRLAKDTSAWRMVELVYDGIVYLNEKLEPMPGLAESWENTDEKTWIFKLRKNVSFHNGKPFTAEDVEFTYNTVLDEKFGAPYRKLYDAIEAIEILDSHTIKFALKEPYAPFLAYLNMGIVPKDDDIVNKLNSHPVGTGPFRFIKWNKNNSIAFEANTAYWRGAPKCEKLTAFIIPDNTTRAAALESGDIDFIHSPLSPQDIQRFKNDKRFVVDELSGLGFTYLGFNFKHPILSDVRVRKALAHLVDRKTISKEIYQSMDSPASSVLLPSSWAYSPSVTSTPYDPDKAKALLAEAGWKDSNGDGILDKDGRPMSIVLSTHAEDPNRIQTVEFLQYAWSSMGIDVEVLTQEWPSYSRIIQGNKGEAFILGWLNLVDPDRAMYNQFHSKGGTNWGGYDIPGLDELLENARVNTDNKSRAGLYQKAAQLVNDHVAYHVLLYQGHIIIHSKDLKGFIHHPGGNIKMMYKAQVVN